MATLENKMENFVYVKELLKNKYSLNLQILAGEKGLYNKILKPKIQKKGLAFAGLVEALADDRVLIIGNTEITFFKRFTGMELDTIVGNIFEKRIPVIIFTNNNDAPESFYKFCNRYNVPLLKTKLPTSEFIKNVTKVLEDLLTPQTTFHGVLLDIHGMGVLIEGESGIGKSEIALDMVLKGHRFVADDVVIIKFIPPNMLIGKSPAQLQSHLEVRGLGIIDVSELFGVSSIREEKRIDMIIRLTKSEQEIDRLNSITEEKEIFGVKLPYIILPVGKGRNVSTLIEIAARILMLRKFGHNYDPTAKFIEKLYKNA